MKGLIKDGSPIFVLCSVHSELWSVIIYMYLAYFAHISFLFQVIVGAGHHVYADRSENFNNLLNQYLDTMDKHVDNEKVAKAKLKRTETEVDIEEYPITQV